MTQDLSPAVILSRRFGYGPAAAAAVDAEALVAGLAGADRMQRAFPVPGQDQAVAAAKDYQDLRKQQKLEGPAGDRARANVRLIRAIEEQALRAALARIVATDTPLRERLAWFWADHFTVRSKTVWQRGLPGAFVDEAIRPHLTAPFGEMLTAAVLHPAMVLYLDQAQSVGPGSMQGLRKGKGINENLAREVLELHTLGVGGGYTQTDVRQFAELLTGLTFEQGRGAVFKPRLSEPGAETVLGVSYGGPEASEADIRAVLADLALRPETARHLARKLAVHFVADDPPKTLVMRLEAEWLATGGNLAAIHRTLVTAPEALTARFPKVRPPFEFLGAALRALGVPAERLMQLGEKPFDLLIRRPLLRMGQRFQAPPGPDGWPEEADHWLTPQGLAERIDWAMGAPAQMLDALPDPAGFAQLALGMDDADVTLAAGRAETRAEAVGLVLASPAFNRR
jgi:uncharacterized protein (DUF1800 family)